MNNQILFLHFKCILNVSTNKDITNQSIAQQVTHLSNPFYFCIFLLNLSSIPIVFRIIIMITFKYKKSILLERKRFVDR